MDVRSRRNQVVECVHFGGLRISCLLFDRQIEVMSAVMWKLY